MPLKVSAQDVVGVTVPFPKATLEELADMEYQQQGGLFDYASVSLQGGASQLGGDWDS